MPPFGYPHPSAPSDTGSPRDGCFSFQNFSARAFSIETQLQEWICPDSPDSSLVSLAEAYRSAALIYLYRVLRHHIPAKLPILNVKIARRVDAIVQHVSDMPIECLPECTMLFPLFLAGGEAASDHHTRYIRHRLAALAAFRRFRNVDVALEVLEELWHRKERAVRAEEAADRMPDWLDILKERGWKLPLS